MSNVKKRVFTVNRKKEKEKKRNYHVKKILFLILLIVCYLCYFYRDQRIFSHLEYYDNEKENRYFIWQEAEDTINIIPSFEIIPDKSCSNGYKLSLPEGVGSLGETSGKATYDINIPYEDDYYLWTRVKWEGGCDNLFFFNIPNVEVKVRNPFLGGQTFIKRPNTIGKDNNYGNWHWLGFHILHLTKGIHKMDLTVGLDGSHIDQFMFTNDVDYVPQGNEKWEYASAASNFGGKTLCKKDWNCIIDQSGGKTLFKKSNKISPIFYPNINTDNLYYTAEFASTYNFDAFINLESLDKFENYYGVKFNNGKLRIYHNYNKQKKNLITKSYQNNTGYTINKLELFLSKKSNAGITLSVIINGSFVTEILMPKIKMIENLGINIPINGVITKSNIRKIENFHLSDNFYCGGPIHYERVVGNWELKKGLHISDENKDDLNIITGGGEHWRNYQISITSNISNDIVFGPIFRYKDLKNYYGVDLTSKKQDLYKILNGKKVILGTSNYIFKNPIEDMHQELSQKLKEENKPFIDLQEKYDKDINANKLSKKEILQFKKAFSKNSKALKKNYQTSKKDLGNQLKLYEKQYKKNSANNNRITVNCVNSDIQVFMNGKKIIQVKDNDLYSGKVGFSGKVLNTKTDKTLAIRRNITINNVEINSLKGIHPYNKNESLVFLENKEYPAIISVMDDNFYGEGLPFLDDNFKDDFISDLMKSLKKTNITLLKK